MQGFVHNPIHYSFFESLGLTIERDGGVDGPTKAVGIEVIEPNAIPLGVILIKRRNSVSKTAGVMNDWDGAITEADHLGQTAWLKGTGHENEIGSSEGLAGERFIEVGDRDAMLETMHPHDVVKMAFEGAISDHDKLKTIVAVGIHNGMKDIGEKLAAFLNGIQARGPEEKGRVLIDGEAQLFLKGHFVQRLVFLMCLWGVSSKKIRIMGWIERWVWGVEDAGGVSGLFLGVDVMENRARQVTMDAMG